MRKKRINLVLLVFFLFLPPLLNLLGQDYLLLIAIEILPMALFALSFDLLLGFTGLLNFGQSAFFGMGAYLLGYSLSIWNLPFGVALILVFLVCAGLGVGISLICKRTFYGIPFTFITLSVSMVITKIYSNLPPSLSGGETGYLIFTPSIVKSPYLTIAIGGALLFLLLFFLALDLFKSKRSHAIFLILTILVSIPVILFTLEYLIWIYGVSPGLRSLPNKYYLSFFIVILCYFLIERVSSSPAGHVWMAIREGETRVEMLGYNVFIYKMLAVIVSGIVAGLAGALYAEYALTVVYSEVFSPFISIDGVLFVILGGTGTLSGSVLGATIIIIAERVLYPYLGYWTYVVIGVFFILIVLLFPKGIIGTLRERRRIKNIEKKAD